MTTNDAGGSFARHVQEDFREPAERGTITVHEIVQEGNRTAQRHRLDITTRDGATIRMEVDMFAEYASARGRRESPWFPSGKHRPGSWRASTGC